MTLTRFVVSCSAIILVLVLIAILAVCTVSFNYENIALKKAEVRTLI